MPLLPACPVNGRLCTLPLIITGGPVGTQASSQPKVRVEAQPILDRDRCELVAATHTDPHKPAPDTHKPILLAVAGQDQTQARRSVALDGSHLRMWLRATILWGMCTRGGDAQSGFAGLAGP